LYLKRIELNGFKSFNKRKEFIIKNGITGIVGPNGSGKSNIADAIRWVLGEQSSKNLRGTHMEDVIFNGSQELAKKGYCEVELLFDNADMRIQSEYTEISVRRKMYRSGESEYSINDTHCRLKDILELFRDTGIGKEGYSIIGQGKIDEILNNKAIARRKVFEEAAGIMKYRVRKEEAERNLEKTHENILRLEDIIEELKNQVEPLEKQMQDAKRYLALRDRLKFLEVNLYLYNQEKSADRIQKLNDQLDENEQEQKEAADASAGILAQISELKNEFQQLQADIDKHNLMIADFGSNQEKLRGELNVLSERESNIRSRLDEISAQSESAEQAVLDRTTKVEELTARIEELNTQIDERYQKIQAMRDQSERLTGGAESVSERYNALRAKTAAMRDDMEAARREAGEKKILLDMVLQKEQEVRADLAQADRNLEALTAQKNEKDEAKKAGRERNAKLMREANDITARIGELQEQSGKIRAELEESKQQLGAHISNQNLLNDIKEGYQGYQASVKSLFGAAKEEAAIKSKLIGTFAELVEVPTKYETAIEAALGNALQNVVVQNEEDAKDVIDFLRKKRLGRVTFLPLKALSVRTLTESEKKAVKGHALCVASEITESKGDVRKAVDFLLARTVIVEDMDSAIALMRKTGYSFRTVTLKGDIMRPGGIITGGSIETRQTGLLSRNRMLAELGEKIKTARTHVEKLSKQSDAFSKQIIQAQESREKVLGGIREREIEGTKISQQLDGIAGQLLDVQAQKTKLEDQMAKILSEAGEIREYLQKSEPALAGLQETYEKLLRDLSDAEEAVNRESEERAAAREDLSKEEIAHNETVSQKNMLVNELEHIRSDIFETKDKINTFGTQAEALTSELKTVVLTKKHETALSLDDLTMQLKNASALAQEKFTRRGELLELQKNAEAEHEAANERKSALIEQKYKIVANIEKTELIRENLQNKIWDDYALTFANAEKLKGDFSYMNGTREIEEIKEEIASMGPVNPNAIEDYARVSERLEHMTVQRDDLVQAGEDLKVVIESLLGDMKDCFLQKFEQINTNFAEVFGQLFGGGHAEVLLVGDKENDIMDCGIEIIAEPPGKKLQSISLLSGGEKALTAIALLFAMLHINPSPVCLLDEIDAPLDEANVIRFSEYLKMLSSGLQFIVITHRKPTMAACDSLYGIAMHRKGVSEVVSVELS
jgi:chromosome segregation protein